MVRRDVKEELTSKGEGSATLAGTPQGGVISPLLANLFLHVLDRVWGRHCAHLGALVRYADDFVVMCRSQADCEEARRRVDHILQKLGLQLHPDKTRSVELTDGKEGFDYLQRWPSQRAMKRVRERVRQLTPRGR